MSYDSVKEYFEANHLENKIILFNESSATVELAAKALGREPGEIAKTLALKLKNGKCIVLVTSGTARIDNRKYKDTFQCKAQMLSLEETPKETGHPVGGVCPFALPEGIEIYLDTSLKKYSEIFPAAGTANSAVKFTIEQLEKVTRGNWVSVTHDSAEPLEVQ